MLHKMMIEDHILAARFQQQPNLVDNIRESGKKLLAVLIMTGKQNPVGQLFVEFWDQGYGDEAMPFTESDRPTFCDEDTWEQIRFFQDQLTVAELKSLKDDNRFHDFEESQPLPLKKKKSLNKNGGNGVIFAIDLLDLNPEIYRLVWVSVSFHMDRPWCPNTS